MTETTRTNPAGPAGAEAQQWPACRLTRLIGRTSDQWTVDDLVGVVETLGIRLISLMHVGGDGWLKTLDFVPRDLPHLREVLSFGERADGSSLFGSRGVQVTASDVVLRPRLSTAFVDPFASFPTLVVFCAHFGRDGAPLPESPDTILRKATDRLHAEMGVELQALGEVEFFLGKRPDETDIYGATERGYHASSPFVFGEALRTMVSGDSGSGAPSRPKCAQKTTRVGYEANGSMNAVDSLGRRTTSEAVTGTPNAPNRLDPSARSPNESTSRRWGRSRGTKSSVFSQPSPPTCIRLTSRIPSLPTTPTRSSTVQSSGAFPISRTSRQAGSGCVSAAASASARRPFGIDSIMGQRVLVKGAVAWGAGGGRGRRRPPEGSSIIA
jgi:hypothetical protein